MNPKPQIKHKPERLPKKMKRMTLVVGAVCSDGMFFCADSEEGTLLGNKRAVRKLAHIYSDSWQMAIGAAGFGPLCDIATRDIAEVALNAGESFLATREAVISDQLKKLYDRYISDAIPDQKRYERQIALVVGIVANKSRESFLYKSHEEIVQPITDSYACAGVGEGIAEYFLARLFQDFRAPTFSGRIPNIREASRLLQFVMREAKASVGGVGGHIDTLSMQYESFLETGSFGAGWEAKQPNLTDMIEHFWLDNKDKA